MGQEDGGAARPHVTEHRERPKQGFLKGVTVAITPNGLSLLVLDRTVTYKSTGHFYSFDECLLKLWVHAMQRICVQKIAKENCMEICSQVPYKPLMFCCNVKYLFTFTLDFHLMNDRHWDIKISGH